MQERGIRMLIAASGAVLAGLASAVVYDSTRFIRREYTVCSDKMRKRSKAVLLSDLHNRSYGKGNERLLAEVERIAPDFIVVAGDMVTANGENTCYEVPLHLLKCLAKRYPVYYGLGNHEHKMKVCRKIYGDRKVYGDRKTYGHRKTYRDRKTYGYTFDEYKRELETCGVRFLENGRIYLPEYNIEICGLEMARRFYKRLHRKPMEEGYMERLLGKAKKDCFELLIGHNPDYFKEYAEWGADLTVSGHVHGGVVKLPLLGGVISPALRLFPEYDGGLFEMDGKTMVLSRGLGMHTIPIRVFNPAELVVIHLMQQ